MLELIEVQTGSYLGEDDIIRIEDDYAAREVGFAGRYLGIPFAGPKPTKSNQGGEESVLNRHRALGLLSGLLLLETRSILFRMLLLCCAWFPKRLHVR